MNAPASTLDKRVAESARRQLNRANVRLHYLVDRYKECTVVAISCGLGLVVLAVWALVPAWRRGHEAALIWAGIFALVVGAVPWLIARARLKRQIVAFWAMLPDLASQGVHVIERGGGLGPPQLTLETSLPEEDWPRWLHRKAGELPSVGQYVWSLYQL